MRSVRPTSSPEGLGRAAPTGHAAPGTRIASPSGVRAWPRWAEGCPNKGTSVAEFITGNQAVVRGALAAGCDYIAGYPITPASSILSDMIRAFAGGRGIAVQVEDEIAAIGQCISAAMCGARAMSATSGPGLSLFSENIGFAQMIEAPVVIIDCQRLGPSTGGATMTGEGDVYFARHVTAGGYPLPVFAATDAASAYRLTYKAFQVAEELRTPVIVLLSKDISSTRTTVDFSQVELPPRRTRRLVATNAKYVPYAFDDPAEVPAFAPIGGNQRVRATGSIHDLNALLTTDSAAIERKLTHLRNKIEEAALQLDDVEAELDADANVLIVSYGLPDGAAREAVERLRADGTRVSHLTLFSLWPIPELAIRAAAGPHVNTVIVPELNIGLYVDVIRRVLPGVQVESIVRYDGGSIGPQVLMDRVRAAKKTAPVLGRCAP